MARLLGSTGAAIAKPVDRGEKWRAVGLAFPTMRSVGLGAGPVLRQQDSPCHARRGEHSRSGAGRERRKTGVRRFRHPAGLAARSPLLLSGGFGDRGRDPHLPRLGLARRSPAHLRVLYGLQSGNEGLAAGLTGNLSWVVQLTILAIAALLMLDRRNKALRSAARRTRPPGRFRRRQTDRPAPRPERSARSNCSPSRGTSPHLLPIGRKERRLRAAVVPL
jgi:hypothetical protein